MMTAFIFSVLLMFQPTITILDPVAISADLPTLNHSEPHLSINPADPDEMAVAAIVMPDSAITRVEVFYTEDGGNSWYRQWLPFPDTMDMIDPWTGFDGKGNAYVSILATTRYYRGIEILGIDLFKRAAGSENWVNTDSVYIESGGSFDQPKMGIDLSGGLRDGTLYLTGDRWGPRTPLQNRTQVIGFVKSIDGGESVSKIKDLHRNNILKGSLNPVVLSDGTVVTGERNYMLIGRNERQNMLWSYRSDDGGDTFTEPHLVISKNSPIVSILAADASKKHTDRLYLSSIQGDSLYIHYSDSKGEQWSEPKLVSGLPGTFPFIANYLAVDGKGNVGILWKANTLRRDDRHCHQVYFSLSTDGGERFVTEKVLNAPYCVEVPGNRVFIGMNDEFWSTNRRFGRGGEYLGLIGLPDGGFYGVWVENLFQNELHLKGARISVVE